MTVIEVERIARSVDETEASMRQVSDSVEQLEAVASRLNQAVSRFRC